MLTSKASSRSKNTTLKTKLVNSYTGVDYWIAATRFIDHVPQVHKLVEDKHNNTEETQTTCKISSSRPNNKQKLKNIQVQSPIDKFEEKNDASCDGPSVVHQHLGPKR